MEPTDIKPAPKHPVVTTIERYEDAPDLCTIHLDPSAQRTATEAVKTAWLSAEEGSYWSLLDWR